MRRAVRLRDLRQRPRPRRDPSAEVGVGIKAFRDPALSQDFAAPRLPIDVVEPHLYAVDWDADEAVFTVDGRRRAALPAAADVPAAADARRLRLPAVVGRDDDHLVPRLVVDRIAGNRA